MLAFAGWFKAGGYRVTVTSIFLLLVAGVDVQAQSGKAMSVMVLSASHEVFYFKVSKDMLKGTVEVYNDQQQLVGSRLLDKKKMIIDFFEAAPGNYKIKVMHQAQSFEYTYQKESAAAQLKISGVTAAAVGY